MLGMGFCRVIGFTRDAHGATYTVTGGLKQAAREQRAGTLGPSAMLINDGTRTRVKDG